MPGSLVFSMGASVDGFINDRAEDFTWTELTDDLFRFHIAQVSGLDGYLCGRRLYETMLPWETDPAMRSTPLFNEFADIWCALPKVVFSRSLKRVEGNARLATSSLQDEIGNALAATDKFISIGGAGLARTAIELDLVDEFRIFRHPIIVGGGTPYLPPMDDSHQLRLVQTEVFAPGIIFERYQRVRGQAD